MSKDKKRAVKNVVSARNETSRRNISITDDDWQTFIFFTDYDCIEIENEKNYTQVLAAAVNAKTRQRFNIISKDQLHSWAKENKGNELAVQLKTAIDSGEPVPPDIYARVIKSMLLTFKAEGVERKIAQREGEAAAAEDAGGAGSAPKGGKTGKGATGKGAVAATTGGKGNKETASTADDGGGGGADAAGKKKTKLKKRAEKSDQSKTLDDEPANGPDAYYLLHDLVSVPLLNALVECGISIDLGLKGKSQKLMNDVEGDDSAVLSSTATPVNDGEANVDDDAASETEKDALDFDNNNKVSGKFWRQLDDEFSTNSKFASGLAEFLALDLIFDDVNGATLDPVLLFDSTVNTVYEMLKTRHRYIEYLDSLDVYPMDTMAALAKQRQVVSGVEVESGVDLRVYNRFIGSVPEESVTVSIILDCALRQVEHTLAIDNCAGVNTTDSSANMEIRSVSTMLDDILRNVALSNNEVMSLPSDDIAKTQQSNYQKESQLLDCGDGVTLRCCHLTQLDPEYSAFDAEHHLLANSRISNLIDTSIPSDLPFSPSERAVRRHERIQSVVSSSGNRSAISEHLLRRAMVLIEFENTLASLGGVPNSCAELGTEWRLDDWCYVEPLKKDVLRQVMSSASIDSRVIRTQYLPEENVLLVVIQAPKSDRRSAHSVFSASSHTKSGFRNYALHVCQDPLLHFGEPNQPAATTEQQVPQCPSTPPKGSRPPTTGSRPKTSGDKARPKSSTGEASRTGARLTSRNTIPCYDLGTGQLMQLYGHSETLYTSDGGEIFAMTLDRACARTTTHTYLRKDGHVFASHCIYPIGVGDDHVAARAKSDRSFTTVYCDGLVLGIMPASPRPISAASVISKRSHASVDTDVTGAVLESDDNSGSAPHIQSSDAVFVEQEVLEEKKYPSQPIMYIGTQEGLHVELSTTVVRQRYPAGRVTLQPFEFAVKSVVLTELSRSIFSDGTVICFMLDGSVQVLLPNGNVLERPQVKTTELDDNVNNNISDGRAYRSAGTDTSATCWETRGSNGQRLRGDGSEAILLHCETIDPKTGEVLTTREDRVMSVLRSDGTRVTEHADGTRITVWCEKEDQPKKVCVECAGFAPVTFIHGFIEEENTSNINMVKLIIPGEKKAYLELDRDSMLRLTHGDGSTLITDAAAHVHFYPSKVATAVMSERSHPVDTVGVYSMNFLDGSCEVTDDTMIRSSLHGFAFKTLGKSSNELPHLYPVYSQKISENVTSGDNDDVGSDSINLPRLFVVHEDGTGMELLRDTNISGFIETARSDDNTTIVEEDVADGSQAQSLFFLTRLPEIGSEEALDVSVKRHYAEATIIPHGLLSAVPRSVRENAALPLPPRFLVRHLVKYNPLTPIQRRLVVESCARYVEWHQARDAASDMLVHQDPRSASEQASASAVNALLVDALGATGNKNEGQASPTLISCDFLHANSCSRPTSTAVIAHMVEVQKPHQIDESSELHPNLVGRDGITAAAARTSFISRLPNQSMEEVACNAVSFMMHASSEDESHKRYAFLDEKDRIQMQSDTVALPPYFDSKEGIEFLEENGRLSTTEIEGDKTTIGGTQAENIDSSDVISVDENGKPDMTALSASLPPFRRVLPQADPIGLEEREEAEAAAAAAAFDTTGSCRSTPTVTSGGSRRVLPPIRSPTPPQISTPSQSVSTGLGVAHGTRSLTTNITGEMRRTKVKLPRSILGGKPGATPNERFTLVEEPVRRKSNTVSTIQARHRTNVTAGTVEDRRGFELYPTVINFGKLEAGHIYRYPFKMRNIGIDSCRFRVRQPSERTGIRVVYKAGPVAAGMSADCELELLAKPSSVDRFDTAGIGHIHQIVEIITETHILRLSVVATLMSPTRNSDLPNVPMNAEGTLIR